ncbi:MAG: response regulator [Spirochaeta sp.]
MPRVLVIEDSRSQQELLKKILSAHKYDVEIASSGEDGLAMLKEASFDAIITDIILPGKSGIELIMEIRKLKRSTAGILAISGGAVSSVQSYLETARIAGAHVVLSKPFQGEALLKSLQAVIQAGAAGAAGDRGSAGAAGAAGAAEKSNKPD